MEIGLWLRDFKDAIKKTKSVLKGVTFSPLKHLYVEGNIGDVRVVANNLESCVEVYIDGKSLPPGKVLIDTKTLSLIEKIKPKEAGLGNNWVKVSDGKIECNNKVITYNLGDDDYTVEDYPPTIECKNLVITAPADAFSEAFDVVYACDRSDCGRETFEGVCIDNEYFVASDSYILAHRKFEYENKLSKPVIIPYKSVELLRTLLKGFKDDVKCYVDDDVEHLCFELDNIKHTIRLTDKPYLKWRELVYPEPKTIVTINVKDVLDELKLLQHIDKSTKYESGTVKLKAECGIMKASARSLERSMTVDIPVLDQIGTDMDYEIYVDGGFLIRMLEQRKDETTIAFAGAEALVVVGGTDMVAPIKPD